MTDMIAVSRRREVCGSLRLGPLYDDPDAYERCAAAQRTEALHRHASVLRGLAPGRDLFDVGGAGTPPPDRRTSTTPGPRGRTIAGIARPLSHASVLGGELMTEMQQLQEAVYSEGVDYRHGSPHLTHWNLFDRLVSVVREEVRRLDRAGTDLDVLEIGAGHGGFTEPVLAAGCSVTAVEMSRPALDRLVERYGTNDRFRAVLDPDGSLAAVDGGHSMVLAVSVLHHIPDYLAFLTSVSQRLRPGGTLLALQDPLWFPRAARPVRILDKGAFYAWRLGQGDLRRGFGTVGRRLRGVYDEQDPSDMVEYHAVRDGVDELAVRELLQERFDDVSLLPYWSHVAPVAQRLGDRFGAANTFAVIARGCRN